MKVRVVMPGEIFSYCYTESRVYEELHKAVEVTECQELVDYYNKEAIARIKELKQCQS